MPPLVSIVTPVYNGKKYIEEMLLSVSEQTYQYWEHIIVDDASTDGTKEIIEKYAESDSRIHLISLHENTGVANARNIGVEKANGDYVAFLDADDQWKENKLECHMEYILKHQLRFSYSAYEVINEKGEHIKNIIPGKMKVNYTQLLYTNVIPCCTVIIESELIKNEKMPAIGHEDYATWLNILRKNNIEAVGINQILSIYRLVGHSISSNKWKTIIWNWKIYYKNQQLGLFKSLKYLISFITLTGIKYVRK